MGRTAIAAMLIGSGDKFLTWCAELIFRWRFSTMGKLTAAPSDIPVSCSPEICWFVITFFVAHRFIHFCNFAVGLARWIYVLIWLFNKIKIII